jgi:hypothetical protein
MRQNQAQRLLDGTKALSPDWLHFLTPAIIYYTKCIGEDFPVKNVWFVSFQLAKNLAQILQCKKYY